MADNITNSTTRIYAQNINDLSRHSQGGRESYKCEATASIQADIVCFAEWKPNTNMHHIRANMESSCCQQFPQSRSAMVSSKCDTSPITDEMVPMVQNPANEITGMYSQKLNEITWDNEPGRWPLARMTSNSLATTYQGRTHVDTTLNRNPNLEKCDLLCERAEIVGTAPKPSHTTESVVSSTHKYLNTRIPPSKVASPLLVLVGGNRGFSRSICASGHSPGAAFQVVAIGRHAKDARKRLPHHPLTLDKTVSMAANAPAGKEDLPVLHPMTPLNQTKLHPLPPPSRAPITRAPTTQPMETDDDEIKPKHGAKTGKKSE